MTPDRTSAPAPGPVRSFAFPPVHRSAPAAGDAPELLVARHGRLPLVTVDVVVEGGAEGEPAELAGIARMTADALEVGTADHDVEELAWELESLGVDLQTSAGWDAASVGVTVPLERLDSAVALLAEIVRRPAFPDDQVQRLREEQLATILQRRKEPRALAADAAAHFIFERGTPYGRPLIGTEESVRGVGPEELRRFHAERYRAGSAAIIVAGAVDHERAEQVVRDHFGDWRGDPAPAADLAIAPHVRESTVFIVHRPGSVQSELRIGHVGVPRHHEDYFALIVMNTILGGAFTSRLNMSLRERHGFTYGARSSFAFRRGAGPFTVDVAVGSDVTARALEETLREIRTLRQDGPTEEEMTSARDYLRGVLPLRLQTTDQLAGRLAELVVFDLPDDYFASYRDRIAAVDADDVRRVANQAIQPDRLAVIVVGDAEQIEESIRSLDIGPVEIHETLS